MKTYTATLYKNTMAVVVVGNAENTYIDEHGYLVVESVHPFKQRVYASHMWDYFVIEENQTES